MTEKTVRDWMDLASKELKGSDPQDLVWQTPEGIPVKGRYGPEGSFERRVRRHS